MSLLNDSSDDADNDSEQATLLSVTEDDTSDAAEPDTGGGGGAATAAADSAGSDEADITDDDDTVGSILPSEIDDDQITEFRHKELDDWIAEREANGESYAFYHLEMRQYSDLTSQARWLAADRSVVHSDSVEQAYTHPKHGFSNPDPDDVIQSLVTWKLNRLSTPHHEAIRPVKAENVRVFVAEEVIEALAENGIELRPVLDQLRSLEEHEATDDFIDLLNEYRQLKAEAGYDGPLEAKKKHIEQTVRAKFGFTGRYASATVPDPHVEYAQFDVIELKKKLEAVRDEIEEKRDRKDELKTQLDDYQNSWVRATLAEEFPSVRERLSDD